MEGPSGSATRPQTLKLDNDSPCKSTSPSPASEVDSCRFTEDLDKFNEVTEFMKEIEEILDFMRPFPRSQKDGGDSEIPSPSPAAPSKQVPRAKVDHLENLIRLVEQLKDLKEQNYESRQKAKELIRDSKSRKKKFQFPHPLDLPPPPDPPIKHRPSLPFRRGSRSKSISGQEGFPSDTRKKSLSQGKSKISKWTKVKEAFRWEKATQLDPKSRNVKVDKKDIIPEANEVDNLECCPQNLLKVPERPSGTPSPADSVLSGHNSICSSIEAASTSCLLTTSGYSGEPSSATHSHSSVCLGDWAHYPLHSRPAEHFTQSLQEISSSSGDEKPDDCPSSPRTHKELIKTRAIDETDTRRSKSLDGDTILGPSLHLFHEYQDDSKSEKHRTPWEKVIDIIQTRKDSLKKKGKKREDTENFTGSADFPVCSDGASSPEETGKECTGPKIEVTVEKEAHPTSHLALRRLRNSPMRPLTPVLTLTTPSTEDIQKIVDKTAEADAPFKSSELSPEDKVLTCTAPPLLDAVLPLPSSPTGSGGGATASPGRSRWGRVKKAFLTSAYPEGPHYVSSSAPSSPLHMGAFFSEHDSGDELSSGDWMEARADAIPVSVNDCVFRDDDFDTVKVKEEDPASVAVIQSEHFKADELVRRPRESLSIPLPTVNDLSPEFRKKLDEWKKIKKSPTTPGPMKDEGQGHFISRIGEWQRWRPGSAHKGDTQHHIKHDHHIQDEFYKKLEEWQMLKSSKRSRSHSDKGKDERDFQTPSPGISRKNSKRKKVTSGKSSGSESQGGSLKEKEGRAGRKSQKEKDLLWLEKELQKIEREKLRLEREREKYLEREARLEQMKRTMGTTTPTQEVLIQTATGFFRFEGISHKFTQKLYEWEKARGIAPEASTFALLEKASVPCSARDDRHMLHRSKSVGSMIDSSSATALSAAHHPSSLSLNDVHDLEALEQASMLADAARISEEFCTKEDDEPEALIVDVEDIVVETAAILVDEPQVQEQVPVYSYAPTEVTHLIDSSGSDGERELHVCDSVARKRKSLSEKVSLIEENITLLDKIEKNETICRSIEDSLEGVTEKGIDRRDEGENLQLSFMKHSGQQEEMAHDLVDKLRTLHETHVQSSDVDRPKDVSEVIEMSSQLLALAQRLETALNERHASAGAKAFGSGLQREKGRMNRLGSEKVWYSIEEENSSASAESVPVEPGKLGSRDISVNDLSSLITKKVLDLKTGLGKLRQVSVDESAADENAGNPATDENECTTFTVRLGKSSQEAKRKAADSRERVSPEKPGKRRSEKGLEKSKAQIICSESAAEVYEQNLRINEQKSDSKKSPEVLKKRIKDKILEMQRLAYEGNTRGRGDVESSAFSRRDDGENKIVTVDSEEKCGSLNKHLKARRITDTAIVYQPHEPSGSDPSGLRELVELTGTTPNFVFVSTSRKIISPIETDNGSSVLSYVIDDIDAPKEAQQQNTSIPPSAVVDIGMPPMSNSPSSTRKLDLRDSAASIKMMVAKYNKKAAESQEKCETRAKAVSTWRSPVLDRKIKEQMAKFEDDGTTILKHGGKFGRGEVLKSSSAGFLKNPPTDSSTNSSESINSTKGILKSSSTGTVKSPDMLRRTLIAEASVKAEAPATPTPTFEEPEYPLALRAIRIRQAKAEFLAKGPGGQSWCSDVCPSPASTCSAFTWRPNSDKRDSASIEMKTRNRLSHASVGSDTSFDDASFADNYPVLVKSASVGMISVPRESAGSSGTESSIQKTVSTSSVSPAKSKKFTIFNIKSKFRKVKMRKGKEKESAVQTLVRQSLLVDVSRVSDAAAVATATGEAAVGMGSRSCPASPVPERSRPSQEARKWPLPLPLTRPKLFQNRDRTRNVMDSTSGSIT